ncbi:nucleoside deaminase [Blattabacterium cuenoti]|uniref:nucleoside deaminase n=1 Tax=Blattabacterium cuenoti TaxID=1653831 RepID=UPI00163CF576|nr:nucleoside deaminase [Blattabacterium cuenoti]
MQLALQEAMIAFHKDEVPIGAVITCNDCVIARAHNLTESLNDITAHAELLVIKLASNFLNKKYIQECTIYVTMEPCIMCAGALCFSQIGRVICGATNVKRGFFSTRLLLHPKTQFISGIMKNECSVIIKKFFLFKRTYKFYLD